MNDVHVRGGPVLEYGMTFEARAVGMASGYRTSAV